MEIHVYSLRWGSVSWMKSVSVSLERDGKIQHKRGKGRNMQEWKG